MFLVTCGHGNRVYKIVRELPDGLSFLCRRVRINDEFKCVINPDLNSLEHIRAVIDEADSACFENVSLYGTWDDLLRDYGACEV